MREKIKKLYEEAPRFDCGELYQSEEYDRAVRERLGLEELLQIRYGADIAPLLDEYTAALYQLTELECMHFFEQGYLAGNGVR